MVNQEVIIAELKDLLTALEEKHHVKIILREVDVFDAEYVRKNGIPEPVQK